MGESFTIQISSNLVRRLTDDGDKTKKKTKKPKPNIPEGSQQLQRKMHQKQISDNSDARTVTPGGGWPLQSPLFLPVPPTPPPVANIELDAIRSVLQESERVLESLQKQEAEMLQEVTQKAKELHDKEFKLPYQKPMPCLAEKDACHDCYKEHAKDPLKCAHVVKTFADCARKARQQMFNLLVRINRALSFS
ncbi:copper ion binding protein [Tasmannia lanceolata]|uniref:copper ion binding protein n=1 Tax=Tasmannia lanceolata TaxID=3420 RepID=UPI004063FA74